MLFRSYTRITNPTQAAVEDRIAALEGGAAGLLLASGQSAITLSILNLAGAGDSIAVSPSLYGGSFNLFKHTLSRLGITAQWVEDPTDPASWRAAADETTRAFFVESIPNPKQDIPDLRAIADVAHEVGVPLIVDNTVATPFLLRPLEHGADIVVHSATKFLGGHGTSLGGVIVEGGKFDWRASGKFPLLADPDPSYHGLSFADACGAAAFCTRIRAVLLRDTGAVLSPFDAFLLLQGLETLSLRVERHVQNALRVVEFLNNHPAIAHVNHPSLPDSPTHALYQQYFPQGGGSIFTAELKGGREAAEKFMNHLELAAIVTHVADTRTCVLHPASTTHRQLSDKELTECGVTPDMIRFSVGIENVEDILADIEQALASL